MSTFQETLKRLISRNIVITKTKSGKLKTIDFNKAQSQGSPTQYQNRPKWKLSRGYSTTTGYGSGFTNEEIEALRKQMYQDYDIMDTDAIVSSVIDIFSDESSTYSEQGELLVIKTNDEKIKKILHNLFYDVLNIDFNLWPWIRTACKYGDNFLYLQVAEGVGVVNVMPIHPILMIREEGINGDPQSIRFRYEGEYGQGWSPNHYFEETEIAHFRLLTDVNFLPYGRSILEGGRQEFKRMRLMEDAMLLNRIMRAPERRLFKIDIGNIAPEEVDGYIEEISNTMKKTPYIDPITGDLNLRYNILNAMEDFFLPVRGSDSGTSIETLPGLQNDKMLEDVEYFKNKMIAAFKVPKDYIGYSGEDNGGTGGKSNLAAIDIRFARTIERVQKIFVSEFYKIALIHLISQGFESEDLLNFELTLTNPSLVFERQKTDVLTARVDLAKSAREENPLLSDTYIYKNLWGFSDEELEALKLQKVEDAKFQFRLKQIVEEGNDPEVTGKSFGTPHDIATMQVASKFTPGQYGETNKSLYTRDEREDNQGKPEEHKSSFETRRDQDFGDDPNGRKDMNKMEALIKKFEKYKPKSKQEPQMLSEENLLEIEDNYN